MCWSTVALCGEMVVSTVGHPWQRDRRNTVGICYRRGMSEFVKK
jgi:hypothetical protein